MSNDVQPGDVTNLLLELRNGSTEAADKLIPLVYDQLRRLARTLLRHERASHTLQPTAIVNDALLRLIGDQNLDWKNRAHFFAVSSNLMRRILIDHARAHRAEKRGGDLQKVELDEALHCDWRQSEALLALDEALNHLEAYDIRLRKVVEMRFFAGMTEEEIAEALSISTRTVMRDWQLARDWLYHEMTH